ncbi:Fe-S cluster assembly sulfur transfer protein SufU [Limibacillus sp. MBR-115]|jgi:nitrogen fixation NifU-like protein|uniref:Fe-S cluster assembly sulfur transfer protein SufU n=1 Tax=Limibacillus sp. MBR-115 TaxID=3156465 RepID=UPI0033929B39
MLDELRELYQEVILDHGKNPRNLRRIGDANHHAQGNNPMCGDTLSVYLLTNGQNLIEDVSFIGKGCAISMASASMMTEILKGKTVEEAATLFHGFHDLCTKDDADLSEAEATDADAVERLQVLSGVRTFPVRVKCATLAWHTMDAALKGDAEISTE